MRCRENKVPKKVGNGLQPNDFVSLKFKKCRRKGGG
jgi:hypothetical protein